MSGCGKAARRYRRRNGNCRAMSGTDPASTCCRILRPPFPSNAVEWPGIGNDGAVESGWPGFAADRNSC